MQARTTTQAPDEFLAKTNPLASSSGSISAGKVLFLKTAQPVACVMCHGEQGDGKGLMGAALMPPPRNFTCGAMMKDVPDGQLFWIIKNGIKMTGMPSFSASNPPVPDQEIWAMVAFLKKLQSISSEDFKAWSATPAGAQ